MKLEPLSSRYLNGAAQLYRECLQYLPYTLHDIPVEVVEGLLVNPPTPTIWYVLSHEGGLVGLAGYENIRWVDRVAEPLIAISPTDRGKGLGHAIGVHLLNKGIKELNLRRIQSVVLEDAPSRHVLVKLGFKEEGRLVKVRYRNGVYVDAIAYALLIGEE